MHLQKSAKLTLLGLLILPSFLSAQKSEPDEKILSKDRLNIFKYNQEENEQSSSKLKKDWINPINLSYSKDKSDTSDTIKSAISISQPIFKSGGIYSAIKYAGATYKYNTLDIELQKKELIKEATTMLFNLHITTLNIKKSELLLKNANIDVDRKKEQVIHGFLDTSTLDNAILDANEIKNQLADLYYQKEELIYNFSNIASGDYRSFELPILKLVDEKAFLKENLELSKARADVEQQDYYKDMIMSNYLPSLSVEANHTQYHEDKHNDIQNENIYSYGLSLSMPLDVRAYNDVQSQRINYLTKKLNLKNTELEEKNFYRTKLSRLKMLENKKTIAKEDYKLYNSLLEIIIEEKNAEVKTQSDVDTLENSQKIKSIELKIYELEKQIELLDLYAKIS
ncbi:TolC family protein [Halarcobacter anaerophilus]|jgi:outer membrane protein TolC|uniref:TolC family protein n=1 Tax=Halarcobacter anaerophilus TaxID=877500 RepID=UPI0005CAB522|nr:TolC family protein [Halarcobacter anaerophilus]